MQGDVYSPISPGTLITFILSTCHSSLMDCHRINLVYLLPYRLHFIQSFIQARGSRCNEAKRGLRVTGSSVETDISFLLGERTAIAALRQKRQHG